jgi:hypothetical protein
VLGAVGVGAFLFRTAPREVTLVYDLSGLPGASALEVEIRQGDHVLRRAELRVPAAGARQVRHPVRLADGAYEVVIRVLLPGAPLTFSRPLEVREEGPVVLPLGR